MRSSGRRSKLGKKIGYLLEKESTAKYGYVCMLVCMYVCMYVCMSGYLVYEGRRYVG